MIRDLVSQMQGGVRPSRAEAGAALSEVLGGSVPERDVQDYVSCLASGGETADELLGMLDVMGDAAVRLDAPGAIDMCGTGGDGMRTFNVSTTASFLAAAAGARVAKHGNYSSSGATGSADMFECLGYDLGMPPSRAAKVFKKHGICFAFAPRFHPAMARLAAARKAVGRRTAFNVLGPLSNPARVARQLVGVSSERYLGMIPEILAGRGSERAVSVMSADGMDELSTSCSNRVAVAEGAPPRFESLRPEDAGLHRSEPAEIVVGGRDEAAAAMVGVLYGTAGRAMIETAALNAGGGLYAAGIADGVAEGARLALDTVKDGRAARLLEGFVGDAGDMANLEAIRDG